MHDLYEGIVPYELKLLICYCINRKYFTIDELNGRMERYGFEDNKPRLFDPSHVQNVISNLNVDKMNLEDVICNNSNYFSNFVRFYFII